MHLGYRDVDTNATLGAVVACCGQTREGTGALLWPYASRLRPCAGGLRPCAGGLRPCSNGLGPWVSGLRACIGERRPSIALVEVHGPGVALDSGYSGQLRIWRSSGRFVEGSLWELLVVSSSRGNRRGWESTVTRRFHAVNVGSNC